MIPAGQIFVIGDSHIGLSPGSEKPIMDWLDRFALLQPRALYLNGDLFHYFIADRKFYTPTVDKVFGRFRQLRDSGVAVHYVEGNRDFFLKGSFVEESVTDVSDEYSLQAGDRKYLIVHGDLINDRDYPYRFWRRAPRIRFRNSRCDSSPAESPANSSMGWRSVWPARISNTNPGCRSNSWRPTGTSAASKASPTSSSGTSTRSSCFLGTGPPSRSCRRGSTRERLWR